MIFIWTYLPRTIMQSSRRLKLLAHAVSLTMSHRYAQCIAIWRLHEPLGSASPSQYRERRCELAAEATIVTSTSGSTICLGHGLLPRSVTLP